MQFNIPHNKNVAPVVPYQDLVTAQNSAIDSTANYVKMY